MVIVYLDKDGNVRPPNSWKEVRESICNNWDSCSPCSYCGSLSRTHGGYDCTHPLHPKLGVLHNDMPEFTEHLIKRLKEI
jgi:hypothetical protein